MLYIWCFVNLTFSVVPFNGKNVPNICANILPSLCCPKITSFSISSNGLFVNKYQPFIASKSDSTSAI